MKVWFKYIYILHTYTYGRHIVNQSVLLTGKSGTSAIGIYTSQWSTDQTKDYRLFNPRHASIIFTHLNFTALSFSPSVFFLLSSSLFLSSYFLFLNALGATACIDHEVLYWIKKGDEYLKRRSSEYVLTCISLLTGYLDHSLNELFCLCGEMMRGGSINSCSRSES